MICKWIVGGVISFLNELELIYLYIKSTIVSML